jgi:hypothetical protein
MIKLTNMPAGRLDGDCPFRVRVDSDCSPVPMSLRAFLQSCYASDNEPHWAVATLPDPRGTEFDEIIEVLERGTSDSTLAGWALGFFDLAAPGWLPMWFPVALPDSEEELASAERLRCFDVALASCASSAWPPQGSLDVRKLAIARCLVRAFYLLELEGTAALL